MKSFLISAKGALIVMALLVFTASCKKDLNKPSASQANPTQVSTPRAGTLIWSDEFNGTSVNTANWNIENGNPGVNNEKEYYQSANATVGGGLLTITARQPF